MTGAAGSNTATMITKVARINEYTKKMGTMTNVRAVASTRDPMRCSVDRMMEVAR